MNTLLAKSLTVLGTSAFSISSVFAQATPSESISFKSDCSSSATDMPVTRGSRQRQNVAKPEEDAPKVEEKKPKVTKSRPKADENEPEADEEWQKAKTIYEFTVKDIEGNDVSLEKYRDHPVIIVNVASRCGHTSKNYKQLVDLYGKYEARGLKIAAFPCNQFGGQEPKENADIKTYTEKKGVTFDVYAKNNVNGPKADPLYKWLKSQLTGANDLAPIKWNFAKFLINKEGIPIKRYAPAFEPMKMEQDILGAL